MQRYQEFFLTILYTADIIITQIRLRKQTNTVIFEQAALQSFNRRYLIFGIIASLPLASLFSQPLLQLGRLFKLIKVVHLIALVRRVSLSLANNLLLAQILYWTLIATHWLSCGWLLIRGFDNDIDAFSNYVGALYWTTATLTTVGYGDVIPVSDQERLYAVFTMIFGYSLFGYLIGSVAGILSKKDPAEEKYKNSLEKLANAVKYANLPLSLQQRIYSYFTYVYARRVGYDEKSFTEELPPSLRAEVSMHFREEVIERVSLFKEAPPEFILDIAEHLTEQIIPPGDCIFHAGETGHSMYLIARGKVGIYLEDSSEPVRILTDGDYFGEIALFEDSIRTATVRAETYCDLYTIDKKTFDRVFARYPSIATRIREEAEIRVQSND